MPIPNKYNTGYNIGVGGAVVDHGRLLMVRRASRRGHGNWQLPGGYIEPEETIEQAVVREVFEEAGVKAEVDGIFAVRNRYDPDLGNGLYVVLVLHPTGNEPKPDGREVDRAEYLTLEEIERLTPLPPINLEVARRVLAPDRRVLLPRTLSNLSGAKFTLFVG
ncbi:MAG: NUDIX domain-containing protein [Deltaproteobacteria bacterium]|nr:NUDIX domain-containing protein [Deltaproteobacteria bacterium]